MERILNYIDGEAITPESGVFLEDREPATNELYAEIPDSGRADVDRAVEAAWRAFPKWSNLGVQERSDYMLAVADGIEKRFEEFVLAESTDNGKPIKLARAVDIPRAMANFRFFATAILHFASESHFMEGTAINYTLRRPIGVVGCISPWNLPLYLFTWKIAPALAAGNCVVAKPSEVTPMTAYLLSQVCKEVGLPEGVLNIVHGSGPGAGAAIVEHPRVKAISFTGGTKTGAAIAATAAPMFKKLSLELGGKNPNLVFADCDFEKALRTSIRSSFANQGQICLCGPRILVQDSIYERFRDRFVEATASMVVGDPRDDSSDMGAVVSEDHKNKVLSYFELAREEGGNILTGGAPVSVNGRCIDGHFLAPTVVEGLAHTCRTNQEEVFGPMVSLIPFKDEDDALAMANSTEYGLSATLWTSDLNRAHRMAENIQAGIVWINCWLLRDLRTPFGGVKSSGVGREGGWEALRFFTEPKNVCVKYY